jgi:hypothetical protein
MRGYPGPKAKAAATLRQRKRLARGLITIDEAAKLAGRAERTIHLWYDSGEVRGDVLDHRRYVRRVDVIAVAKRKNMRFA